MASENKGVFKLLMVGRTGEGKSATGNSILGKKVFKACGSATSTTKYCQIETALVQDYTVVLVDTPGLADTDMTTAKGLKRLEEEVRDVLYKHPEGFDAILLVMRYGGKITAENKMVFDLLDAFFGETYTEESGILVITHYDNYDPEEHADLSIEEFLRKQEGVFGSLRDRCHGRLVFFDNRTKDGSFRHDQVKTLLDVVEQMKEGGRYTPEAFKNVQSLRDRVFVEAKKLMIEEKTEAELRIIMNRLETTDVATLGMLAGELKQLGRRLEEQDKGTGALSGIMSEVLKLESSVRDRTKMAQHQSQQEMEKQAAELEEAVNDVKSDLEKRRNDLAEEIKNLKEKEQQQEESSCTLL